MLAKDKNGQFNSEVEAFTYQLTPERCNLPEEEAKPSKVYKNVILKGANEHKLPQDYIEFLESISDNGDDGHVHLASAVVRDEL